jgi:Protein of unknown function (DUF3168)
MSLRRDLKNRLSSVPLVQAESVPVAWIERPRSKGFPAIVLQVISANRDYTHSGPDNLDRPRIQIDYWGYDLNALDDLANAVRAEMEQVRDIGSTRFEMGFEVGDRDYDPEILANGNETLWHISRDYMFYYSVLA